MRKEGLNRRQNVLSCCILGIFSSVAAPVPVCADQIQKSSAESREFDFSVRAQTLRAMLAYYGKLTGLQYFYSDPAIGRMPAAGVEGHYTLGEALRQSLAGTGYAFVFTDAQTVVIRRVRQKNRAQVVQLTVEPREYSAVETPIYEVIVSSPRTTALGFKKISPTTVLDGRYLEDVGIQNIAQALYDTPAVTASRSAENTVYTSHGPSVNMLDLRDLGVVRTLVVVNGRRHVPTNGGSADFIAVDVNVLPVGLVERIEVLTTGASVLYGADAVGGLVNVTLHKDYEGFDIAASGNIAQRGDSGEYNISASLGQAFGGERGHYMAFLNVKKSDGLKARDRFISSDPAGFALNGAPTSPYDGGILTRGFGRAAASQTGTVIGFARGNGSFQNFGNEEWVAVGDDGLPAGDYEGLPEQRYNWAEHSDLISPIDTLVYSGNLLYEVSDSHQIFFEHTLARSIVERELAPTPTYVSGQQGIFIPIENPFIPDDIRAEIRGQVGDDVSGIFLNRRLVEVGNRKHTITRDIVRMAVGAEGMLSSGWDYSAYYQFGSSSGTSHGTNAVDVARIAISASPEECAVNAAEGCTLTNYFGLNSINFAQADYLRTTYKSHNKNIQHVVAAELRGDILQMPAGPLSLITGLQYRNEQSDVDPDVLVQQGRIGGTGFSLASTGSFNVVEAYLAASLPVFERSLLGHQFTLDVGYRFSHFSTVKSVSSWQLGAEYRPIKSVSFRGSYQAANRAPNLSELFQPGTSNRQYYNDPCNKLLQSGQSEAIVANCLAVGGIGGVPDDFYQRSVYTDGQFSGNEALQVEEARTKNVGVTFKPLLPETYGSLYVSVDWFDIEVRNFIRGRSLQFVINECYESVDHSSFYCGTNPANGLPFFRRDALTHEISDVNLSLQNSGTFNAAGIDTEIVYTQQLGNLGFPDNWGTLRLRVLHSYNLRSDLSSGLGAEKEVYRGSISRPIHKVMMSLTYQNGPLMLDWSTRFRSMGIVNPLEDADIDANIAPNVSYHNLAFRYDLSDQLKIQLGIENLFDTDPPFLAYSSHNTFPEYYDIVGRRFYAGFKASF